MKRKVLSLTFALALALQMAAGPLATGASAGWIHFGPTDPDYWSPDYEIVSARSLGITFSPMDIDLGTFDYAEANQFSSDNMKGVDNKFSFSCTDGSYYIRPSGYSLSYDPDVEEEDRDPYVNGSLSATDYTFTSVHDTPYLSFDKITGGYVSIKSLSRYHGGSYTETLYFMVRKSSGGEPVLVEGPTVHFTISGLTQADLTGGLSLSAKALDVGVIDVGSIHVNDPEFGGVGITRNSELMKTKNQENLGSITITNLYPGEVHLWDARFIVGDDNEGFTDIHGGKPYNPGEGEIAYGCYLNKDAVPSGGSATLTLNCYNYGTQYGEAAGTLDGCYIEIDYYAYDKHDDEIDSGTLTIPVKGKGLLDGKYLPICAERNDMIGMIYGPHSMDVGFGYGDSITDYREYCAYGEDFTFYVVPGNYYSKDYHVRDVRVDGVSVGAVTSYTIPHVTTGHEIYVSFGNGSGLGSGITWNGDPSVLGGTAPAPVTAPAAGTSDAYVSTGADPIPSGLAYTSEQPVLVDGKAVTLQAYALKDAAGNRTNYVKVRDVAAALDGTASQFNVGWSGAVDLQTGVGYTSRNGQENKTPYTGDRAYTRATAETRVNGAPAALQAFVLTDDNGGASTYYKLRDLGHALGFNVGWSAEKGIYIETGVPYDPAN